MLAPVFTAANGSPQIQAVSTSGSFVDSASFLGKEAEKGTDLRIPQIRFGTFRSSLVPRRGADGNEEFPRAKKPAKAPRQQAQPTTPALHQQACPASEKLSGRFDRQRPASYLLVLHGHQVPVNTRLDQRPCSLERFPESWPCAPQAEVDNAGVRCGIGPNVTADIAVKTYQNPTFAPAHGDEFSVCRFRRRNAGFDHVVPLLSKPPDNWAIDVLVGEDSHRHAAELGTSTTSSVASISAAYDWHA